MSSTQYRDGCPSGVVGKVLVGLFIAFAWLVNRGNLDVSEFDKK